jgi:ubiquinone/menaquinone biosynthesis C-methylase UbiE
MNKDFSYLKCISSGKNLIFTEINGEDEKSYAKNFEETYGVTVDSFLVTEDRKYFYPICSNVVMMLDGYYFHKNQLVNEKNSFNPFEMFNLTDKDWYTNYDKIVDFKKKDILKILNSNKNSKGNLVEYLSSSGELITYLKDNAKINLSNFIALDLDFYALKELAERDPSIITICSDATVNIFQDNSISIATSNSMHHIPDYTKAFYKDVTNILEKDGIFVGIESQGILSKIIINIISILPKKIIPYSIKEIHTERHDIKKWLKKSIYERLEESNINSFSIKSYLFHCRYVINKL